MVRHMTELISKSKGPLQFIVFVPDWKKTDGWKLLTQKANKYISIPQKSHGYCEGSQHRRDTRYRIASF
eukprot:UN13649